MTNSKGNPRLKEDEKMTPKDRDHKKEDGTIIDKPVAPHTK
jgi:hypothetical protein